MQPNNLEFICAFVKVLGIWIISKFFTVETAIPGGTRDPQWLPFVVHGRGKGILDPI